MERNAIPTYDFIVVGAGASGCALASSLAKSTNRPQILLLEAGGKNDDDSWHVDGDRWSTKTRKEQSWGYQTLPQKHLNDRVLSYDRGKGLGGSTAINFCAWNTGCEDDYSEISRLVGDKEWEWKRVQQRFRALESYFGFPEDIKDQYRKYLDPEVDKHGSEGALKVGFPLEEWETNMIELMEAFLESGVPRNLDLNSGNPIGLSVAPNTAYKGTRTTAADLLVGAGSNLTILTHAEVGRVLFDGGTKAIAVITLEGQIYRATREIIVSAGSLDTPRILMHSGIGPAEQLDKFSIPVIYNNPFIGQNLRDHFRIGLSWIRPENTIGRKEFYCNADVQQAARTRWQQDRGGPLSELGCVYATGFLKSSAMYSSKEFKELPVDIQAHMAKPTVPAYEIILNAGNPEYFIDPEGTPDIASILVLPMNIQSRGEVLIRSPNPAVPLSFNPRMFETGFDRRVAIEATREVLKTASSDRFKKLFVGAFRLPRTDSDEDIVNYWKENLTSTWHMTGTVKMGFQKEADDSCVGNDFKVWGVQGLRVADMSVLPILPNNHTQSTAYLVGIIASEKIMSEHRLSI